MTLNDLNNRIEGETLREAVGYIIRMAKCIDGICWDTDSYTLSESGLKFVAKLTGVSFDQIRDLVNVGCIDNKL